MFHSLILYEKIRWLLCYINIINENVKASIATVCVHFHEIYEHVRIAGHVGLLIVASLKCVDVE